jgi:hypothetical protein
VILSLDDGHQPYFIVASCISASPVKKVYVLEVYVLEPHVRCSGASLLFLLLDACFLEMKMKLIFFRM